MKKANNKEQNKVEIPKDILKELVEKSEKQEKEIEMLKSAADVGRIKKWEDENKSELIRVYRVSQLMYEGKLRMVLGWETTVDEVGFEDGKLVEKQYSKYFIDMGEGKEPAEKELRQLYFARNRKYTFGEVIKESSTKDGEYKTLKFKDGREIEFNVSFLN